jgi:hypothetical protein
MDCSVGGCLSDLVRPLESWVMVSAATFPPVHEGSNERSDAEGRGVSLSSCSDQNHRQRCSSTRDRLAVRCSMHFHNRRLKMKMWYSKPNFSSLVRVIPIHHTTGRLVYGGTDFGKMYPGHKSMSLFLVYSKCRHKHNARVWRDKEGSSSYLK